MKKFIFSAIGVIIVIAFLVSIFKSCDTPFYQIYDVNYNVETKTITWRDDSDAKSWTITINGEEHKVKSKSFSYDAGTSSFTISIEANDASDEVYGYSSTFNYLETVTGLRVENGCLVWNRVQGAGYYNIYDASTGNYLNTVYECSYMLSPGSFNLYVMPASDQNYFCYESEAISGAILASPTTLTYRNGVFEWDIVYGADYYEIKINDKTFVSNTNSYAYTGNKEDLNISVAAGSNQASAYVSAPLTQTCYYLTPITTFSFNEQGALVWPQVNNATAYNININGQAYGTVSSPSFTDIALDTAYTIIVTPTNNFSYTDEPVPYTFEKLSPVANIAFANGLITWDANPRAASYEVMVNEKSYVSNTNSYNIGNIEESITIQVYARGTVENSRSYMSLTASYTYIPRVENLRIEDGVLVWNASEGASGYKIIYSNGSEASVSEARFDQISPNQQYVLKVRPLANTQNYFTYDSAEFTFTILAAPTITYQQGVFRWNGTSDAKGYAFRVVDPNGQVIIENLTQEQFTKRYEFNMPGKYAVSVKLVANPGNNVYDSQYSTPINVTQLEDVKGHQVINNVDSTATVQITANAVNSASGYKITVNGTEVSSSNSNTFSLDLLSLSHDNTEVTFKIAIKAIGNISSNNVVLDSKNYYEFNLVRLATPQNVAVTGNKVTWNNVSNANKYILYIDGARYECSTTEYTFTNLSEGNHKIKVQAINSNSQTYIPSRYSNEVEVTKLPKPANVRLDNAGTDIVLKWDAIDGAYGYQLQIGISDSEPSDRTSYVLTKHTSKLQGGEGKQVTVYAKGNGANILDSEPSTTITVAKLNAPQNLAVSGDNITWSPAEVDGIMATSYILYIDGIEYPVTGTSFSTENFPEGVHTVAVVAVGSISNNHYTINSDKSGSIYATKFAQVTNVQASGKSYTWDPIAGAEYRVTVDGTVYTTAQPSFEVNFTTAGEHTVTIQAYSKGSNTISSTPTVITQQVSAVRTPTFISNTTELTDYSFTYSQVGDTLTITAKAPSDVVAVGYEFKIEGVVYKNTIGSHTYHITDSYEGCEYKITVRFTADGFGSDGVYYINSATSQDVIFTYSKLN